MFIGCVNNKMFIGRTDWRLAEMHFVFWNINDASWERRNFNVNASSLALRKKFARNFAFNAATRRADESRRKKDEHLRVNVWNTWCNAITPWNDIESCFIVKLSMMKSHCDSQRGKIINCRSDVSWVRVLLM